MDEKNLDKNEQRNDTTSAEDTAVDNTKEAIPVMDKAGEPPAGVPAGPRGSKSWMIASIVLAIALIVVLIKPPFQKSDSDTPVATVNGKDITKEELYDKLIKAGGESTLQSMITQELVDQEADKNKVTVTDADIQAEIKDLQEQFGGESGLESALSQSGMTMDDLKEQMPLQVKIRKLLEPKVTITDDDIKKYYDENKASLGSEEEVRASHILVATKEEADAIEKQLKDGADFATLAKEKSSDTGSKDKGGDLGFFKKADMVAEFSDTAFKMKVGETSEPVKTEYGYHIIKVTDHKDAVTPTLENSKDKIRETLVTQKISEMSSTWMQTLTSGAKITNTLTDAKKAEASASPASSAAPAASAASK
ncbi:peptidylprolyl isomerase [Paenibacillus sp. HN-1]|uniref:peptidylprolyl isomerase n=1 Tax=Paenibacillus TaxID=44249 RepID=UPI001CA7E2AC|nr:MULTISPECIES: peptidylprolyl isomerase [Paenibacillus]MBY9082254.1 peptidylprolyl isomerase [Paenibacillus sp. CGMCC 1.18879]MBY9086382.1 peptidylprolyl isomerase [Paenibacillus sinensis]